MDTFDLTPPPRPEGDPPAARIASLLNLDSTDNEALDAGPMVRPDRRTHTTATSDAATSADAEAAAAFLADWVVGWPANTFLHVAAIPAAGGPIEGRSWAVQDVPAKRAEIAAWVRAGNAAQAGVYFTPNPIRGEARRKAKPTRDDIAAMVCLPVDLDPPTDARSYDERRATVLSAAQAVRGRQQAPCAVVDSGNGLGLFFRLAEPTTDTAMAEAASRTLHRQLATAHGLKVDGTHNADRLMRLPGTLNWPNKTKLARGYPPTPSLAWVLSADTTATLSLNALATLASQDSAADRAAKQATPAPIVAPKTEDERVREAIALLSPVWGDVTSAATLGDLPAALQQRFDTVRLLRRGLLRRWQGHSEGLDDTSRSGLTLALTGCLKAAGFDLCDTARIVWVFDHGDLSDPAKHPDSASQLRAIARAWVRSVADAAEDAERAERVEAAAREAAERALSHAFPGDTQLVQDMLAVSVRADAMTDTEFARRRGEWAHRAKLNPADIKRARQGALAAAAQARRAATLREDAGGRPVIEVGPDLARVVDNTEKALAAMEPPTLFRMGDRLVEVANRPDAAMLSAAGVQPNAESIAGPATIPATTGIVRFALARSAVFTVDGKAIQPPLEVASTIADRGTAAPVPSLRQMLPCPVLRADGTVVVTAGYDAATRVFATSDWSHLVLPPAPDKADAGAAIQQLLKVVQDFPFAVPEGKSAWVAHVLTTLARHLLPTVPGFIYGAPTAGSGKTLLASLASRIVFGRGPSLMSSIVGRGADEEMRKRITSMLLSSRGDIVFDNHPRGVSFGGAALDALLTNAAWSDRALGGNTALSLPNTATVAVTGNNLTVGADTGRRVLFSYLDPKLARPEARTGFAIPDLPRYIATERDKLLVAALTVLAAHIRCNDPLGIGGQAFRILGSFEDWSRLVAAAVEWCGLPNPIAAQDWGRKMFDASDDEAETLDALLTALHDVFGVARFTAGEVVQVEATAFSETEPAGGGEPGPSDQARDALRGAVSKALGDVRSDRARALGKILSGAANRTTTGGWALASGPKSGGVRTYAVERRARPDGEPAEAT